VRQRLPHHLDGYDRIVVLRAFTLPDRTIYKLEEVPTGRLISGQKRAIEGR